MGDISEGLMANEGGVVVAESVGKESMQPCSRWGSVHTCEHRCSGCHDDRILPCGRS